LLSPGTLRLCLDDELIWSFSNEMYVV